MSITNFYTSFEEDGDEYVAHYFISKKGYCYVEYAVNGEITSKKRIGEKEYSNAYEVTMNY